MICFEDGECLCFFLLLTEPLCHCRDTGVGEIPVVRVLCEHSAAWMAVDSLVAVFVSTCLSLLGMDAG